MRDPADEGEVEEAPLSDYRNLREAGLRTKNVSKRKPVSFQDLSGSGAAPQKRKQQPSSDGDVSTSPPESHAAEDRSSATESQGLESAEPARLPSSTAPPRGSGSRLPNSQATDAGPTSNDSASHSGRKSAVKSANQASKNARESSASMEPAHQDASTPAGAISSEGLEVIPGGLFEEVDEGYKKALSRGLSIMDRRYRTAFELSEKLLKEGHAEAATQAAVERLKELGVQSDELYAESFVRSKWNYQQKSPKIISMVRRLTLLLAYLLRRHQS